MSDLTAEKLKKLVVAAIDYWEQNEGDMDTCMCSYLWPKLNGLVAEAVKAARVQALEEAQGIVGCSGTRAFECYDDIQSLIDAEKEAGK